MLEVSSFCARERAKPPLIKSNRANFSGEQKYMKLEAGCLFFCESTKKLQVKFRSRPVI